MKTYNFKTNVKEILADLVTPVSVYLKMRDIYPNSLLLESSDYHSHENSYSFICLKPEASIQAEQFKILKKYPDKSQESSEITRNGQLADEMEEFFNCFKATNQTNGIPANGFFGYLSYNCTSHLRLCSTILHQNLTKFCKAIAAVFTSFSPILVLKGIL